MMMMINANDENKELAERFEREFFFHFTSFS